MADLLDPPRTDVRATAVLSPLLTVDEVARLLRCSPRTVYRLANAGRIPRPVKLGALVRWPKEAIEQWINEGCPQPKGRRR